MKVTSGQTMDEATRAALASGRAEPALALFVESLIEMRGLSETDGAALAGEFLEAETPAGMSPDALERTFAAIGKDAPPKTPLRYAELAGLPAALSHAIREAEQGEGWRRLLPGVRRLRLDVPGKARAEVYRIAAGVPIPWHTHKGKELTLCLAGGFSEARGSYGPGDATISDSSVRHQPKADKDGPCFVLAVTDAGLKYEGVLGAIQKLMGG